MLNHMSPNDLSASPKLIPEIAWWRSPRVPLDHSSQVRSELSHVQRATMLPTHPSRVEPRLLNR